MKFCLIILLFNFLHGKGFAQVHQFTNWEKEDTIYGKVKSVNVLDTARVTSSRGPGYSFFRKKAKRFNTNGNITEILTDPGNGSYYDIENFIYNNNRKLKNHSKTTKVIHKDSVIQMTSTSYKYDNNGNVSEIIENRTYLKNVKSSRKIVKEYDQKNNEIKSIEYIDGILKTKVTLEYDSRNNLVKKMVHANPNDTYIAGYVYLTDSEMMRYDKQNRLIEKTSYRDAETISAHWEYKYDKFGNLIEERLPGRQDGDITGSTGTPVLIVYTYNKNNKVTEKRYRDVGSKDTIGRDPEIFEYDSEGNLIKDSLFTIYGTTTKTYQYNGAKNLIKESEYALMSSSFTDAGSAHPDNSLTEYRWEYDQMNNWTKQITYVDNRITDILKRKIEYYH